MRMEHGAGARRFLTFFVTALSVAALYGLLVPDAVAKDEQTAKKQISVEDAKAKLDSGERIVFLDVREPTAYNGGHIPNAINIPEQYCELEVPLIIPDPSSFLVIYSDVEKKALNALRILHLTGYKNAVVLVGGLQAWEQAGYPLQK